MVETRQGFSGPDGAAAVLEGACVRFGTVEALHGITLTVPRGIHATVIGPNGSGKSTLLERLRIADLATLGSEVRP